MNLTRLIDLLSESYEVEAQEGVIKVEGITVIIDETGYCQVSGDSEYVSLPREFVLSSNMDLEIYIYPFILQCLDGVKRV